MIVNVPYNFNLFIRPKQKKDLERTGKKSQRQDTVHTGS